MQSLIAIDFLLHAIAETYRFFIFSESDISLLSIRHCERFSFFIYVPLETFNYFLEFILIHDPEKVFKIDGRFELLTFRNTSQESRDGLLALRLNFLSLVNLLLW